MTRPEKEDRSRTNKLCAFRARQIINAAPNTTMSARYGLRGPPLDQCVYICFFRPLQMTSHTSFLILAVRFSVSSWHSLFSRVFVRAGQITQGRGMAAKKSYREEWTDMGETLILEWLPQTALGQCQISSTNKEQLDRGVQMEIQKKQAMLHSDPIHTSGWAGSWRSYKAKYPVLVNSAI